MLLIFVRIKKKSYIITTVQIYELRKIGKITITIFAAPIFLVKTFRNLDSRDLFHYEVCPFHFYKKERLWNMPLSILGHEETLKGDFRDFDVLSFSANTKYLPYPLREEKGTLKLTHGFPRFHFSGAGHPHGSHISVFPRADLFLDHTAVLWVAPRNQRTPFVTVFPML